jgi:MAC/Perforin domain.
MSTNKNDIEQQEQHSSAQAAEAVPMVDAKLVNKDASSFPMMEKVKGMLNKCTTNDRKKNFLIGGAILAVVILIAVAVGVAAGVSNRGGSGNNSSKQEDQSQQCRRAVEEVFDINNVRRLTTDAPFQSIGCFRFQNSVDRHTIDGFSTKDEKASACFVRCLTLHFGVAGNECFCFAEAPEERLTIGGCDTSCEDSSQKMEAYFKTDMSDQCNQDTTTAVRNFLVEEDDAPFGYDIVRNDFKQSPFELYKNECGTNIYSVQTEASGVSTSLKTSVHEIKSYAMEQRSSLSQSISASVSAGYKSAFVKASATVSGSYDAEQNAMFKSSGASKIGSRVFTSQGVKRVAEVQLVNFESKRHFVTFKSEFVHLLRTYKDTGFSKETAQEIFNEYGMFIVTRGLFGGYIQYRTTATEQDLNEMFSSDEDSRKCFEASVSGKASGFGFSGSFEVGDGKCTEEAASKMQGLQQAYADETSEEVVVGGIESGGEFKVPPELSTLLTKKELYPPNDHGIQLRILSDFLKPEVISPLEVRRYLLTEKDFGEIQQNLEMHILEELERIADVIKGCGACDVPFLEQTDEGFKCTCYNPSCFGDESFGDKDGNGICDDRPYCNGDYCCETLRLPGPTGYCFWDCENIETSEIVYPNTCSHHLQWPGCCYSCVANCVNILTLELL